MPSVISSCFVCCLLRGFELCTVLTLAAAAELATAFKDWEKFVEVLSTVADKFKFGPSEMGVISSVNQLLLDSIERVFGGTGKVILLIFIAIWKATYVTLRSIITLLVVVIRAVSVLGRDMSNVVSDYLHVQIQSLMETESGTVSLWFGCFFSSQLWCRCLELLLLLPFERLFCIS